MINFNCSHRELLRHLQVVFNNFLITLLDLCASCGSLDTTRQEKKTFPSSGESLVTVEHAVLYSLTSTKRNSRVTHRVNKQVLSACAQTPDILCHLAKACVVPYNWCTGHFTFIFPFSFIIHNHAPPTNVELTLQSGYSQDIQ